ncbi:MAG: hypothetical protein LBV32_01895 [Tannerellaceae bacterium]|jgi:hypothetical protein|nr:hypothetical protein [Tannerellaceae bacterium]
MKKNTDIKEYIMAHFINHEGDEPIDPVLISWLEDDSYKNKYNLKNKSAYGINHK